MTFSSSHRLDFAVLGIQFLQSATTSQLVPLPDAPKYNVGLAQFVEIQRVPAFGRGNFGQAPKMFGQQRGDFGTTQVVDSDFHSLPNYRLEGVSDAMTTA